ncbi:MAG: hypothetical protein EBQ78_05110 [Betaproteobacteria bacterium]|nr:hypothetical protein [Betaproteobacteria bacterium]
MTIVTGHQESGARVLREHLLRDGIQRGLAKLITHPNAYRGRLMDVAAAQRWAFERCGSSKSILIGHSMGAATVMLEAGARNNVGQAVRIRSVLTSRCHHRALD